MPEADRCDNDGLMGCMALTSPACAGFRPTGEERFTDRVGETDKQRW